MGLRLPRSRRAGGDGGAPVDAGTVAVFTIGQDKFVAGLHWKGLHSRSYMREARRVGSRFNWDIVAVRKGVRVQAGFIARGVGVATGMYSIASALAGILGDNWIGMFQIDADRYVIAAVRQGGIIPGYDRVVTKDEAIAAVREAFNLFPDTSVKVYAPRDCNVGTEEISLSAALDPKNLKREYQLRLLGFPWGRLAVILGILAVGVIGWSEYRMYLNEEAERAAEVERIRQEKELAELNAHARAEQQAKALEHPWAKMPAAEDFAKECGRVIGRLPLSIAGWVVDTAKCDGIKMQAVFRRNGAAGAPLSDFRRAARPLDNASLAIAEAGERAEITIPMSVQLAGDEDLGDPVVLQEKWISQLQLFGATFRLEEKAVVLPAPPVGPNEKPLPPPVATWRLFPVSFESGLNPPAILAGVGDMTGVRLRTIEALISREGVIKWSVQGELYGKR